MVRSKTLNNDRPATGEVEPVDSEEAAGRSIVMIDQNGTVAVHHDILTSRPDDVIVGTQNEGTTSVQE